jgi:hypothetical protein
MTKERSAASPPSPPRRRDMLLDLFGLALDVLDAPLGGFAGSR